MMRCNRRVFARGAVAMTAGGAAHLLTRGAFAAEPRPAGPAPVPGAIALELDREIRLGASSEPIRLPGGDFRVLNVGTATFHLADDGHLTARLNAAVAQYASADYRIYAAMFDAKGVLLGTASHVESVERIRLSRMPTVFRHVDLDFGKSRDFRRAAYASVAVSNPDFPLPAN
jgi:hypothetical protein